MATLAALGALVAVGMLAAAVLFDRERPWRAPRAAPVTGRHRAGATR